MKRRFVIVFMLSLTGCSAVSIANFPTKDPRQSTPVRWRAEPSCMQMHSVDMGGTRERLALDCLKDSAKRQRDFIAIGLSGGGTKAAVFSGETLFYMQALGLLQETSVVSTVSGGSFAGAVYALSCDPADIIPNSGNAMCAGGKTRRLERPIWTHDDVLPLLGLGYTQLVREQLARLLAPGIQASITAERFARFIDGQFLKTPDSAKDRFLFSDFNPRRPQLLINATILSANRGGLGNESSANCKSETLNKHYLRRRNPDEFFHFAYSDFYFGLLHSSIDDFPVAGAVAASAAFPVLVDHATLTDYCGTKGKDNIVTLMDGGVNDNQALIEIYMILTELVLRQHRSDVLPEQPETLSPNDTAFVFIVNSSVSDSTGLSGDGVTGSPHSAIEWVSSLLQKISRSVDVYSGVNYNLRKQLYMTQLKNISADHRYARVEPKEISLTGLDQYRRGGLQAALWEKSGLQPDPTDLDNEIIHYRQSIQRDVYRQIVQDTATRQDLGLSHWHPQCYYDIRERLDASLASVGPDEQDCLRQAARWAVALKTQELCHEAQKSPDHRAPDGLNCSGGVINITHDPSILGRPRAIAGSCDMILAPIAAENAKFSRMDPNLEDSCRDLDQPIQSAVANTSQPVQ